MASSDRRRDQWERPLSPPGRYSVTSLRWLLWVKPRRPRVNNARLCLPQQQTFRADTDTAAMGHQRKFHRRVTQRHVLLVSIALIATKFSQERQRTVPPPSHYMTSGPHGRKASQTASTNSKTTIELSLTILRSNRRYKKESRCTQACAGPSRAATSSPISSPFHLGEVIACRSRHEDCNP